MLGLIVAISVLGPRRAPSADNADFLKWGKDALDVIQRRYWMPDASLYSEFAGGKKPAFDWSVGVMLPALSAAAKLDDSYRPTLIGYLQHSRAYWNPAGPVPGYDVLPMPKSKDRYYDDNEWMALDLVEASQVLGSTKYRKQAQETFDYIQSGWDAKLGGGVYWRESEKTSKNTCSNAPATVAAIDLFRLTQDGKYLAFAIKDYAWTRDHLRDPSDGLYWDNISLDGDIGKAKFSYNSGMMLRAASLLYMVTNVASYAKDARDLQAASLEHWIGPDGTFKDDGKFAFLMMGAWLTTRQVVPGAADPLPAMEKALRFVHDHCRDKNGEYGSHWDQPAPADGWPKPALIDQAAAARAFLSLYIGETEKK